MLSLALTTPPAEEPITLAEAKTHLRVDINDDDDLITALIVAARQMIEEMTRRALITQTWRLNLDNWPGVKCDSAAYKSLEAYLIQASNGATGIMLPRPPLQSITSITYTDDEGTTTALASTVYAVDTDTEPGRVLLADAQTWPTDSLSVVNPIKITYVAGYGLAADVPQAYKQAILLLVGHWYENREATGGGQRDIPKTVDWLISYDRNFI